MVDTFEIAQVGPCRLLAPGTTLIGNQREVTDWDGAVYPEHPANGPERLERIEHPFALLDAS